MKILMLAPDAQMIDRRILQEARTLQRAGLSVTVLSGFDCREGDAYVEPSGVIVKRYVYDWRDRRKVSFLSRGLFRGRGGDLIWKFVQYADRFGDRTTAHETFILEKALAHEFDLVHVHDFPTLRAGLMAAEARGVPLIYDSHEFYPLQSELPERFQKLYLARERKLIRDCAAVITVNPYIARLMGETYGIEAPHVILNASEETAVEARPLRRELGLAEEDVILIYQGWVSHNRNIDALIRVLPLLGRRFKLLLVGYGEYLEVLKDLARDLEVEDRVIFYGRVESDDLPPLTAACDIGLIPYVAVDEMHRYCSPNKLFEFAMAELPVVASDLPYLRDVLDGYGFGVLGDLSRPEALARLIDDVAATPERLAALKAGARRARAELNWTIEGQKLLGIYDTVFRRATL